MVSAKALFGLLSILLVHTTVADRQALASEHTINEEPAPHVEPAPNPMPPAPVTPPSPAPVPWTIPDYQYAEVAVSTFGGRSQAVIGANSDGTKVFVLSGRNATPAPDSYVFDFGSGQWSYVAINFTRYGACYAQDSKRNNVWIFGGNATGMQNTDALTIFSFDSRNFANQSAPPPYVNKFGASCAVTADGSKFYALFGSPTADEDDDFAEDCPYKVGLFDVGAKAWKDININITGAMPPGRRGAGVALYKNYLVTYGGICGGTLVGTDVYRLDLNNYTWTKDAISTTTGPNVTDANVFVIDQFMYVVGGSPQMGNNARTYVYDLENRNWTLRDLDTVLPTRAKAGAVTLTNRVYFLGGEVEGTTTTYVDNAYQFVMQNKCLGFKTCEDCSTVPANGGCGWCNANNDGYKCLAGGDKAPYVATSCNSSATSYVSDIDFCPQAFPSYAIALLVIGGVVVIGVIIFAIMKVRSGEKQEYERIS